MELEKYVTFKINDLKYEFRTLNELDVSQEYIDALEENEFIENIPTKLSIPKQKKYINEILSRDRETICGLYVDTKLIGSCGIQTYTTFLHNIDKHALKVGTVGIFIFNNNYKGLGIGKALLWASIYLLHECSQTEWFTAGMLKENIASLKTFLSCGFKQVEFTLSQKLLVSNKTFIDDNLKIYNVLLNYSELKKPEFIKSEKIINVQKTIRKKV